MGGGFDQKMSFVARECLDPLWHHSTNGLAKKWRHGKGKYTDQVIQLVTFLSPNVGGHQQPSERVTDHHPKKVTKNCQGMISNAVGPGKKHIKIPAGRGGLYCVLHGKKITTGNTKSIQESSKSAWTMGNINAGP